MTRYTICFDEENDADILRWMDAQINKSMSLKALVERSIAQEGFTDIFQLAWKRNIHNSTQNPDEPMITETEDHMQQPRRKRGRPRKNKSSSTTSIPVIPETEATKQTERHIQADTDITTQSDMFQSIKPTSLSTDNTGAVPVPEIPARQNKKNISEKTSDIAQDQLLKTERPSTDIENDGYRRPENVNIDMAKFYG